MLSKFKIYNSKRLAAFILAFFPVLLMAQTEPAKAAATGSSAQNEMFWYFIYSMMGLLLLGIIILSNVLVNLFKLVMDKDKVKAAVVLLFMMLSVAGFSQAAPGTQQQTTSSLSANWDLIMAVTVLVTEATVILILLLRIRALVISLSPEKEKARATEVVLPKFLDNINASVSVEHEKDILLDHNYDGIKELDNSLPPWWKYSFIISIFWAFGYLCYYHLMGGPLSRDEYEMSMQQAKEQQEIYARTNASRVDENTVTMADAAGINEGKTLFIANCAPCHGQKGEGVVGPNFTDDYWLHGGSIKDVFKSIKYGWPAKGMKAWQADLSPVQMKQVASYIKSLRGTNPPNAKAPQGDLYMEGGQQKTDSTAQAGGTTAAGK